MIDLVKVRMERLFDQYRVGAEKDDLAFRVTELALDIQEACAQDPDAALACLNLDYESPYTVVHHLSAGMLCELITRRKGLSDHERVTLLCAALTHDLALVDIQDVLDRQATPLTRLQQTRVTAHPHDGADQLAALGVTEPMWLDTVRDHHERIDGSGYPDKLVGNAIGLGARILGVADMYAAMVRDRPYRKAMLSRTAMRSLLTEQGGKSDTTITQTLIKEVGVFPPGAIVRLENGEVAVVKERQQSSLHPVVYTFVDAEARRILKPHRRDTTQPQHAIAGMLPFANFKGSLGILRSLWKQPRPAAVETPTARS
jgi:HD-GYP domain-containing protein (c-di-GMP phosphodiesterase class II)